MILYHAMANEFEGDALTPRHEREINGKTGKYLFATPYLAKTLMFAFNWNNGEAILGAPVEESRDHCVILCERSKTLAKKIFLRVYALSSDGFEKVLSGSPFLRPLKDTREYYTERSIPLAHLHVFKEIDTLEELMRLGLQIFATEKTKAQLLSENFLSPENMALPFTEHVRQLMQHDGLIWENHTRHINPSPYLAMKLQC